MKTQNTTQLTQTISRILLAAALTLACAQVSPRFAADPVAPRSITEFFSLDDKGSPIPVKPIKFVGESSAFFGSDSSRGAELAGTVGLTFVAVETDDSLMHKAGFVRLGEEINGRIQLDADADAKIKEYQAQFKVIGLYYARWMNAGLKEKNQVVSNDWPNRNRRWHRTWQI